MRFVEAIYWLLIGCFVMLMLLHLLVGNWLKAVLALGDAGTCAIIADWIRIRGWEH